VAQVGLVCSNNCLGIWGCLITFISFMLNNQSWLRPGVVYHLAPDPTPTCVGLGSPPCGVVTEVEPGVDPEGCRS
jgi:hypothetical protein